MVHSVLNIALGRLEASAHSDRLVVGGARCKLGRELGLEGPLGFDDEVGTGRAPAGLVGRGDGHLRLGKVPNLDLGAHLRLDKRKNALVEACDIESNSTGQFLPSPTHLGKLRDGWLSKGKRPLTRADLDETFSANTGIIYQITSPSGKAKQRQGACTKKGSSKTYGMREISPIWSLKSTTLMAAMARKSVRAGTRDTHRDWEKRA